MSLESAAREAAVDVARSAIDALVSAGEREQARQRVEACEDAIFHAGMLKRLPRWRWLARFHHRRRLARAQSHCDALRSKGDPVAMRMCACANERGLT